MAPLTCGRARLVFVASRLNARPGYAGSNVLRCSGRSNGRRTQEGDWLCRHRHRCRCQSATGCSISMRCALRITVRIRRQSDAEASWHACESGVKPHPRGLADNGRNVIYNDGQQEGDRSVSLMRIRTTSMRHPPMRLVWGLCVCPGCRVAEPRRAGSHSITCQARMFPLSVRSPESPSYRGPECRLP
jgi:hypothetical protein